MRLRMVQADWGQGLVSLDLTGEGGYPLPIVGVVGNNGSGKSVLMNMAARLFRDAVSTTPTCYLDWDKIEGSAVFEYGRAISTAIMDKGKVIQRLVFPDMKQVGRNLENGVLIYDRMNAAMYGGNQVHCVLRDLYGGTIKNSVLWVDDFDRGLDEENCKRFLQVLTKKALEGDNQLVVSSMRQDLWRLGVELKCMRALTGGEDYLAKATAELNKPKRESKAWTD